MGQLFKLLHFITNVKIEKKVALFIFLTMTALPLLETITRFLSINSIPASQILVQHLTLWIGFVGAVLAAKQNKLLALTRESIFQKETQVNPGKWLAKVTTFLVLVCLALGSWDLVKVEMEYPINIAPIIPRWFAQIIMPLGFGLMALHIYLNSYKKSLHRLTLLLIFVILSSGSFTDWLYDSLPVVNIGIFILIFSIYNGAPIFVGLGGLATLMFWVDYAPISAIPA